MKENPNCPKCKSSRRVIASHKTAVYTPGRFRRFVTSFLTKIINICARIVNRAMSALSRIQRQRYLFKCNTCHKEFQGTRTKKVIKK